MPNDFDAIWNGSAGRPSKDATFDELWESAATATAAPPPAEPQVPVDDSRPVGLRGAVRFDPTPEMVNIPGVTGRTDDPLGLASAERIRPTGPQRISGDDQGLFREAVGAGGRGMTRVGRGLIGAVGMTGGSRAELAMQLAPAMEKLEQEFPRQNMEGKSLPARGANYFVNLIGEQVPYMSANLTAMGLAGPAGFVGSTFAIEGGNTYTDARQRGMSHEVALAEGLGVGAVTAALDLIPANELFSGWISKNPAVKEALRKIGAGEIGERATRAIVAGQAEGLTEAGQEAAAATIQWAMENDPEAFSNLPERLLDAYAAGTTLGTTLGATMPDGTAPATERPQEPLRPLIERYGPRVRDIDEEISPIVREQQAASAGRQLPPKPDMTLEGGVAMFRGDGSEDKAIALRDFRNSRRADGDNVYVVRTILDGAGHAVLPLRESYASAQRRIDEGEIRPLPRSQEAPNAVRSQEAPSVQAEAATEAVPESEVAPPPQVAEAAPSTPARPATSGPVTVGTARSAIGEMYPRFWRAFRMDIIPALNKKRAAGSISHWHGDLEMRPWNERFSGPLVDFVRQKADDRGLSVITKPPHPNDPAGSQEIIVYDPAKVSAVLRKHGISESPDSFMQRSYDVVLSGTERAAIAEVYGRGGRSEPLGITAVNEEKLQKAADEIVATTTARAKRIGDHTKGGVAVLRRLGQRFENWVRYLGPSGARISDSVKRVSQRQNEQYMNGQIDFDQITKGHSDADLELAMKMMNGYTDPQNYPQLIPLMESIREILDRPMNEFAAMGGKRAVDGQWVPIRGSGKAYPQVLNEKGRQIADEAAKEGMRSARVQQVAIQMVRAGRARTMDEALSALLKARDNNLRNVNPYLESTRSELPEDLIEWNPRKTIYGLLRRGWMTVEAAREWGEFDENGELLVTRDGALLDRGLTKLNADLRMLHTEADGKAADAAERYLQTELGTVPHEEPRAAGLFGAISNYQTLVRLGGSVLSAVRNSFQPFTTLSDLPLMAHLGAYKDLPPLMRFVHKKYRQRAEDLMRSGAIQAQTSVTHLEDTFGEGRLTKIALAPFSLAEQGNQLHAALAQARAIEMDLARLQQLTGQRTRIQEIIDGIRSLSTDEGAAIARRFGRVGLSEERIAEALSGERPLTPDEIKFAMAETVAGTQFPITLATKRLWWQNPGLRLLGKFKPFGLDMVGYTYRRVMVELAKGNAAPLVKFLLFTTLAGELYNLMRDAILGKEESLTISMLSRPDRRNARAIAGRLFNNFVDGGGVGMLADLFYGFTSGTNPAESAMEWVAGPAGATAVNIGRVAQEGWQRPQDIPASVKDAFSREIVVSKQAKAIIDRTNRWLGDTENRRLQYSKWKQRSIDYQKDRARERGSSSFVGTTTGPRAKRLDLAARDISVGDIEGAADRLLSLMRDAKTPEQQKAVITSIKSSMTARAPLGRVAKREYRRFLAPFPQEEREEARRLQRQWMKDYAEAARIASRALREEQRQRGRR